MYTINKDSTVILEQSIHDSRERQEIIKACVPIYVYDMEKTDMLVCRGTVGSWGKVHAGTDARSPTHRHCLGRLTWARGTGNKFG